MQAWETKPPTLLLGGLAAAWGCHPQRRDQEELGRAGRGIGSSALAPTDSPETQSPRVEACMAGGLKRTPNLFLCFHDSNRSC